DVTQPARHGTKVTGRVAPAPNQRTPSDTRSIVADAAPAGTGPSATESAIVSPGATSRGSAVRGPSHTRTLPAASYQCTDARTGAGPPAVQSALVTFVTVVCATGAARDTDSGPVGSRAR